MNWYSDQATGEEVGVGKYSVDILAEEEALDERSLLRIS